MNYYAAFVFASRICINYTLHHTLNTCRSYAEKFNIDKVATPLNVITGLSRLIRDPKKYDSRDLRNYDSSGGFNQFRCADTIDSISSIRHSCMTQDLFDNNIIKAIMSMSDESTKEYLNKFLEYRGKIVYEKEEKGVANE
jgi:hypothetical protein